MGGTLKVGMAGYGYWGPNVARNLASLDGVELTVMCDTSERNLARFSQQFPDVETTDDFDALLDGHGLDAVALATTAETHHDLARRALEAGKHCFVEKPLTLTSAEAAELVALAEQQERVLMVGHVMVYHSAVEWIRQTVDSGELGDVLYAYAQRLNLGKVRRHENAFWSLAPHDISVVLYVLGETPESVSAQGADYLRDGVEDVVFASLRFPSGKIANIHVSWLDPHKVRRLTLVGKKKMLVFDDMQATEKVWVYDKGVVPVEAMAYGEDLALRFGDVTVPYIDLKEPLRAELEHFRDCCATGETPRSDGREGLKVVRVLEAVDESMAHGGKPVDIRLGA